MSETPIYDQLMTQQRHEAMTDPAHTETAPEDKTHGLPWLRFWRG